MLEQLELYVSAQKTIANYMLGLGVIMILLAILFHLGGAHSLFDGLKTGCLILGLFAAVSGFAYKSTEEKLLVKQTELFDENPAEFKKLETERMQKVVRNFPFIQAVLVAIVVISLIVTQLVKNGFVNGLLLSLVILCVGNITIEHVSKRSIDTYFEQLSNP